MSALGMGRLYDVSATVSPAMSMWQGVEAPVITRRLDLERGDSVTDSELAINAHTGTHVDAPLHYLRRGPDSASLPLGAMLGRCRVIRIPEGRPVRAGDLDSMEGSNLPGRLLFCCRPPSRDDSQLRGYVDASAARRIVELGSVLVGVEPLSVDDPAGEGGTHEVLLSAGVVVVEGLQLADIPAGEYELLCLPLKLAGVEAAPARVVLRELS